MFEQIRRASEIVFYIMGCSFFLLYMMYHNGIGAEWARWLMELFDQSFILVALLYGGTSFLRTLTDLKDPNMKIVLAVAIPLGLLYILLLAFNYWNALGFS
ncbi:MAG TPA: hypothetical protein VI913_01575 [Candidatus Peribacteraceae bacterium]|nr:hypothetical protein [Candidatus Peribacteraceae bacterium]